MQCSVNCVTFSLTIITALWPILHDILFYQLCEIRICRHSCLETSISLIGGINNCLAITEMAVIWSISILYKESLHFLYISRTKFGTHKSVENKL